MTKWLSVRHKGEKLSFRTADSIYEQLRQESQRTGKTITELLLPMLEERGVEGLRVYLAGAEPTPPTGYATNIDGSRVPLVQKDDGDYHATLMGFKPDQKVEFVTKDGGYTSEKRMLEARKFWLQSLTYQQLLSPEVVAIEERDGLWEREVYERQLLYYKAREQRNRSERLERRGSWQPRPCPQAQDCGVTAVFATLPALEAHYRERHPDRVRPREGGLSYSGGVWYQDERPALKWVGEFGGA
jgi:hypothetical protein